MADDPELRADDPELRIYQGALAHPQSPHLDDAAWERFATGQMSRSERDLALEHVTGCAVCAAICRGLLTLEQGARSFDHGVPDPALSLPAGATGVRAWTFGGLAALAAGLAWLALAPLAGPANPRETFRAMERATRPSPVAPLGRLSAAPREFRWQAVPGAAGYRVELFDGSGSSLWTSPRTDGTVAPWPAAVPSAPGRYYWQVVALTGRSAEDAVSSPLVDFEIAGAAGR